VTPRTIWRGRSLRESGHKLDLESAPESVGEPAAGHDSLASEAATLGHRRVLHEAAHKLEEPAGTAAKPQKPPPREFDPDRDVVAHAGRAVLALGALGVVFGDIGTSPLYTVQVLFTAHPVPTTAPGVYGIASLIFWTLVVIVCVKYAGFIMRAHNRGDGGILALTALIGRCKVTRRALLVTLGIFGASLFLGDGMITPAISVLSAVGGLQVATPGLEHLIVPIALAILISLFLVQRWGTGAVGAMFGPVMLVWFTTLAVVGGHEVVLHPGVLQGLSPTYAVRFFADQGGAAFLTLGAVVLSVTGAEALYADRGHFGTAPIRLSWYCVVFPGVLLSYLGQAALIRANPALVQTRNFSPFFQLVPSWGRVAMVFLASAATVIASQAVISGSYSVAKQAVQLGFLPRLKIAQTSKEQGQIYVPAINWALCIGVVALVLIFRNSSRLAEIYGVAVTGTFVLDTILFLIVARVMWGTSKLKLVPFGAVLLTVEIAFFSANVIKVEHGAWLPLVVAVALSTVMLTWLRGQVIVTRNRTKKEGSLGEFLEGLAAQDPPLRRVPGTAIFPNPSKDTTPLALRAEVERIHALHERVVIVSVDRVSVPHVDPEDRFVVSRLGHGLFRVYHVVDRVGYRDGLNIPLALALARKQGFLERNLDLEHASYFVSRITITPSKNSNMSTWRKKLFVAMARNAASPIEHFGLPAERTVMMGSQVDV
jgi:KUP system potassium uptake protein